MLKNGVCYISLPMVPIEQSMEATLFFVLIDIQVLQRVVAGSQK